MSPFSRSLIGAGWILLAVGPRLVAQPAYDGVSRRLPTGSTKISADGLVASFDMHTRVADGRLMDFGPGGHHARIGRALQTAGPIDQARLFRAVEDRVDLPDDPAFALDGPLTILLWVRVATLGIHQHLIACDDKFALWVTPQNRVRFSDTLGHGMETALPIDADRWYSVAAVFAGTAQDEITPESVRIYVDGRRAAEQLVNRGGPTPPRWMPESLYPSDACDIGFESHQRNEAHRYLPFEGAIDDLTLFSRALTDAEIDAHAQGRR